jgi:hypothetical protein
MASGLHDSFCHSVVQRLTVCTAIIAMEVKIEEPIPDSLSFKQLSMACIEMYLRNEWF